MEALRNLTRRPSEASPPAKDDKTSPPKRLSLFGLRPAALGPRPDPTSPSALSSPKSPPEAGSPSPRRVTDRAVALPASLARPDDAFPNRDWLDQQAQAQGIKPKSDVVIGGRRLWRNGERYREVCSALEAYHACPRHELASRQSALLILDRAVTAYLGKKPAGRYEGIVGMLAKHLKSESQRLEKSIDDARERRQQSPSIAEVLQPAPALLEPPDSGEGDAATPPRDAKVNVSASFSTAPSSDALGVLEASLYAATPSPTQLSHTAFTKGLRHAARHTMGATHRDGEVVNDPDVADAVIKENAITTKRLLGGVDRYLAIAPSQLNTRMAALKELERNVDADIEGSGGLRDTPAFARFNTKLEEEMRILASLTSVTAEAEWQRGTGRVPPPIAPAPQLDVHAAADLIRAGVSHDTLARGLAMHMSREQIMERLAPCARARVPYTAVKLHAAASRSTVVPGSLHTLGSGAVATVWRVDLRRGEETLAMVFKPEPSPETDIGFRATASGIPPKEANFSGRSAAASLCSRHLKLDLVPPTVVALMDIDGRPEAGSLMGFVDGFQLLSERSVNRHLTADQAKLIAAHPEVVQAYALERGCTSARLDGAVLRVERRVQVEVTHDSEGNPFERSEVRDAPALIRMALPPADGRLRRLLADAQLFSRFIRDGDRGPMNIMLTVEEDGRLSPRFIDNDVSFGPDWNALSEPGTTFDERRLQLPPYVSRALKDAFDGLATVELGESLEAVLGSASAALSVMKDVSIVRTLLARYEREGRILAADSDWESPAVTEALGLNLAGPKFVAALASHDEKSRPSFPVADARITALKAQARTCSYLSREVMEERWLELEWAVLRLHAKETNQPLANYVVYPALFDFDELMRRLHAAGADTKAGPSSPAR